MCDNSKAEEEEKRQVRIRIRAFRKILKRRGITKTNKYNFVGVAEGYIMAKNIQTRREWEVKWEIISIKERMSENQC